MMSIDERAKRVNLLLMDCDGVLTDGRLYFGPSGEELKVFHVRDGQGIVAWHEAGFRSGIISGRDSPIVELRARQLGIGHIIQGCKDKTAACLAMLEGTVADEVCFIGDDIPDIDLLDFVGLAVAAGDAHDAVKARANYITIAKGGHGVVREVIDMILRAKSD